MSVIYRFHLKEIIVNKNSLKWSLLRNILYSLLFSILTLSACASSQSVIQTAIASTQVSLLTPTSIPTNNISPKTLKAILLSYGYEEHPELSDNSTTVFRNESITGIKTITLFSFGELLINYPSNYSEYYPLIADIYGKFVADCISDNLLITSNTSHVAGNTLNRADCNNAYSVSVFFASPIDNKIEYIEIYTK